MLPNFGRFCSEKALKGPNLWTFCFPRLILPNSRKLQETLHFFYSDRQKMVCFLKPKCLQKSENYRGPNFFPRRPKFSAKTGRKVLVRVGNTARAAGCLGGRALAAAAGTLYRNVCSTSVSQSATAVRDKESTLLPLLCNRSQVKKRL